MSIIKYLKNPYKIFSGMAVLGFFNWMPDKAYLKMMYRSQLGKKLNLDNPQTFNEKLQWLKLYDRRPEYSQMVDKYEAKKYVSDIIGEEYIIPTLGVWERFDDINFSQLPNKFVLKCTHDSGGLVICRDKDKFDMLAARRKINKALKRSYYKFTREWPYKNVKPRIIAEKYMEDQQTHDLRDYKIYAFDGVAKALMINAGREKRNTTADYYLLKESSFIHLDFSWGYPNSTKKAHVPKSLHTMIDIAEQLSQGIPELRCDFYEVNGKTYFGELTFFDGSGFAPFKPQEWDDEFGKWVELPNEYGGGYVLIGDGFVLWSHKTNVTSLTDYKYYCFNGSPKMMYISNYRMSTERKTEYDFFDMDFNHLDFCENDEINAEVPPQKPVLFDKMRELAETLSRNIPHVRCDFYVINHKIYFGELTFFSDSGWLRFRPEKWDLIIGNWICLPNITNFGKQTRKQICEMNKVEF